MKRLFVVLLLATFAIRPAVSQDADSYTPMFNGKDLAGWVNVNCDPSTFYVKDGMIITTGRPIGFLRTDKQYENFVLEFDWMHQNKKDVGNSGLFVWGDPVPAKGTGYTRGIEVQVLVNLNVKDTYTSHGDIFSIWGARCKPDRPHPKGWERCLPSEERAKGGGEWNHYKVFANDGVIKLEVNGKEVSGVSQCNPRKGYLALESEAAECWFKNVKIKELPSTNPKPEEIADVDKGFKTMYYGLNLNGWKQEPGHKGHWRAQGTNLTYDGKSEAEDKNLWTDKSYGDFEMMFDVSSAKGAGLRLAGKDNAVVALTVDPGPTKGWKRVFVTRKGDSVSATLDGKEVVSNVTFGNLAASGPIGLQDRGGPAEYCNLFIRELK
jgi:hypothetical protein